MDFVAGNPHAIRTMKAYRRHADVHGTNASTMVGNMQGSTGSIQNELYAGRLVWNKMKMIKDAHTGKRLSCPNLKSDWQIADVPDLRMTTRSCLTPHRVANKRAATPIRTSSAASRRDCRMREHLSRLTEASLSQANAERIAARRSQSRD